MPSKAALKAAAAMKKAGPEPLSDAKKKPLIMKASAKVDQEESECTLFDEKAVDLISRFEEKELNLGKKLGEGGFCSVFEVTELNLSSEPASAAEQNHKSEIKEFHTREYMSKACLRRNSLGKDEARYAVKQLSEKSLADEDLFEKGIADLATEAHFLAVIQHRNIIKVRGYALGDFCTERFFIMMDRLHDTLEGAIRKWKESVRKNSSVLKGMSGGKKKVQDLFSERIEYAWDIANAMEFLHSKNIIYRDLKPENLGFDVRGDIKIFDFGLSKEVRNPDADANYKLTGYTGSPIYMAPEVMQYLPYNLTADSYSFAILVWEMISLNEPYRKVPKNIMEKMVVEKDYRPKCDEKWPATLTRIILKSWDPVPKKRPSFTAIKDALTVCIEDEGGGGVELDSSIDRSTRSYYMARGK